MTYEQAEALALGDLLEIINAQKKMIESLENQQRHTEKLYAIQRKFSGRQDEHIDVLRGLLAELGFSANQEDSPNV